MYEPKGASVTFPVKWHDNPTGGVRAVFKVGCHPENMMLTIGVATGETVCLDVDDAMVVSDVVYVVVDKRGCISL